MLYTILLIWKIFLELVDLMCLLFIIVSSDVSSKAEYQV